TPVTSQPRSRAFFTTERPMRPPAPVTRIRIASPRPVQVDQSHGDLVLVAGHLFESAQPPQRALALKHRHVMREGAGLIKPGEGLPAEQQDEVERLRGQRGLYDFEIGE